MKSSSVSQEGSTIVLPPAIAIKERPVVVMPSPAPKKSKRTSHGPQWQNVVAGACAGAFSRTVMAPVERVKLLLQLQRTVTESDVVLVKGQTAWQVARSVYREQGLLSFWRGNLPNVMRTAGAAGLNFSLMDYYKQVAVSPWLMEQPGLWKRSTTTTTTTTTEHQQQQQLTRRRRRQMMASFISGGLAGATATTVLYPVEFLRTRLAMDLSRRSAERTHNTGMMDVVRSVLRSDGIIGLYHGYGITVAAGIVYRLLHLGGYDALKIELLSRKRQHHYQQQQQQQDALSSTTSLSTPLPELSWTERFLVAEFVTLTAGTICYPFDSVRRRMMMQAGLPLDKRLYSNSFQCMQRVWAQEGIRGFYLGLAPNIVRSLGGSLLLVAYDAFKTML